MEACDALPRLLPMHFEFEIGRREKNRVEFDFNQLFGRTVIKVNGKPVTESRRLVSEPLSTSYEFTVGEMEPLVVRIEKQRRLLWTSRYKVSIDHRLLEVLDGH